MTFVAKKVCEEWMPNTFLDWASGVHWAFHLAAFCLLILLYPFFIYLLLIVRRSKLSRGLSGQSSEMDSWAHSLLSCSQDFLGLDSQAHKCFQTALVCDSLFVYICMYLSYPFQSGCGLKRHAGSESWTNWDSDRLWLRVFITCLGSVARKKNLASCWQYIAVIRRTWRILKDSPGVSRMFRSLYIMIYYVYLCIIVFYCVVFTCTHIHNYLILFDTLVRGIRLAPATRTCGDRTSNSDM